MAFGLFTTSVHNIDKWKRIQQRSCELRGLVTSEAAPSCINTVSTSVNAVESATAFHVY